MSTELNNDVKLSPPWCGFYKMMLAMFGDDPEIELAFNESDPSIKLFVNNPTKAEALGKILPEKKEFGNVSLDIAVVPANSDDKPIDVFRKALAGNPVLSDIVTITDIFSNNIDFVGFANEVVQYKDDRLDDPYGLQSTLYEDIAREMFVNHDGVFFYTDVPDDFQV